MTEQDSFSQRLMSARSLQGMSQQALAEASGVAAAQISRYESGKSSPRPEVVAKMSRAMGVDFDWLFTGNGPAPIGVGQHQNRQLFFGDPTALVVRIPTDMQAKLKAAAEEEGHSLEAEILIRLESSFLPLMSEEQRAHQLDRLDAAIARIEALRRPILERRAARLAEEARLKAEDSGG